MRVGEIEVEGGHAESGFLEGSVVARMMRGSNGTLGRGEALTGGDVADDTETDKLAAEREGAAMRCL